MKRLLYIALLFICSVSFGQYTVKHEGKTVMLNGKVVRIQADDMPDYSSPEPPEPSDDSIFDVHWIDSFEGWAIDDEITHGYVESKWGENNEVTSGADSLGLGYGSTDAYRVNIEEFPVFDGTTNTGETSKYWFCRYVEGEPVHIYNAGFRFHIPIDPPVLTEFYFSYDMIWMPGTAFHPMDGDECGKIPGPSGDPAYTDGDPGPPIVTNDVFHAKNMFRDSGDSIVCIQPYLYYYNRDVSFTYYGQSTPWLRDPTGVNYNFDLADTFADTTNTNITWRVVPNTFTGGVANADGYIEYFVNGKFSVRINDMILSTIEGEFLEQIDWAHFWNGEYHDGSVGPNFSQDMWVAFDNPIVWTYTDDSGETTGKSSWGRTLQMPDVKSLDGY